LLGAAGKFLLSPFHAGPTAGEGNPGSLNREQSPMPEPEVAGAQEAKTAGVYVFRRGKKNEFFTEMADFAQRYGSQGIPRLLEFLQDPDWEVRCAALRALGLIEDEESKRILLSYVRDDVSVEESAQASLALGDMEDPKVTTLLLGKVSQIQGEDLRRALFEALVGRPFEQTAVFFGGYLNSPAVSGEEKGRVLAGLGFHQTAPVEMLASFAANPAEAVRQGAYEGLASRRNGRYGQLLLGRLPLETEPALRGNLYEAVGAQQDTTPAQIAAAARAETDPAARLRAQRAWAMTVGRTPNMEDQRRFNQEAVPALHAEALNNPDPGEQRAALQALAMARTPDACTALQKIAQESLSPALRKLAEAMSKKIKSKNPATSP
jgi:hypothetical protein